MANGDGIDSETITAGATAGVIAAALAGMVWRIVVRWLMTREKKDELKAGFEREISSQWHSHAMKLSEDKEVLIRRVEDMIGKAAEQVGKNDIYVNLLAKADVRIRSLEAKYEKCERDKEGMEFRLAELERNQHERLEKEGHA